MIFNHPSRYEWGSSSRPNIPFGNNVPLITIEYLFASTRTMMFLHISDVMMLSDCLILVWGSEMVMVGYIRLSPTI